MESKEQISEGHRDGIGKKGSKEGRGERDKEEK